MQDFEIERGEMFHAAVVGVMRHMAAIHKKRIARHGEPEPELDRWGIDIESCAAEQKVAKWLNVYWHAFSDKPHNLPGDAGEYQVRHTTRLDGSLILHDQDKDDATFILVVGEFPNQKIIGWLKGVDGKQKRFWDETKKRPAYFVEQKYLKKPEELLLLPR